MWGVSTHPPKSRKLVAARRQAIPRSHPTPDGSPWLASGGPRERCAPAAEMVRLPSSLPARPSSRTRSGRPERLRRGSASSSAGVAASCTRTRSCASKSRQRRVGGRRGKLAAEDALARREGTTLEVPWGSPISLETPLVGRVIALPGAGPLTLNPNPRKGPTWTPS